MRIGAVLVPPSHLRHREEMLGEANSLGAVLIELDKAVRRFAEQYPDVVPVGEVPRDAGGVEA
jgi:hypothetical protein